MSISKKQHKANRNNAQKSTGPKSKKVELIGQDPCDPAKKKQVSERPALL